MATKTAPKKVTVKPSASITFDRLVEDALESVSKAKVEFETRVLPLNKSVPVDQTTLNAGVGVKLLGKDIEALWSKFTVSMKEHKNAGGSFEPGKVAIKIDEADRRNVAWKEEAFKLAKRLCELEGRVWDEKVYFNTVEESVEAKPYTTVSLTVSD